MPLEKLIAFTKKVQDLSDKPNATMTAAEVKAQFDAAPDEVRVYLNKVIDALQSSTDGDSGADNVGATPISTSPSTVQGILEWLKTQIDSTVLGQIPDGSITDVKLSDEPTEIKQLFNEHQADDTSHVKYGVATGTNPKVVTLNPAPTSLGEGFGLSFKNVTQNTGAVTLNINGLGAKPVVKSNGNALASGNLKASSIYTVRYDGTSFILQGEGGEYGSAVASHVLAPNTIGTENGLVTGTMVNRGAFNLGFGQSVPAGYYSGGLVPNGALFASGSITVSSSDLYAEFHGLSFKPRVVVLQHDGLFAMGYVDSIKGFSGNYFNNNWSKTNPNTIYNNGFKVYGYSAGAATYYAWG